jgi:hypothetical protein
MDAMTARWGDHSLAPFTCQADLFNLTIDAASVDGPASLISWFALVFGSAVRDD